MWALFHMKQFLDASPGPHLLFMDHLAIISIADAKLFSSTPTAHNPQLVCFALILAKFCLKLQILHHKGMYMAHVDTLSCIQAIKQTTNVFHAKELVLSLALLDTVRLSQATDSVFQQQRNVVTNATGTMCPYDDRNFGLSTKGLLYQVDPSGHWWLCIGLSVLSHTIALAHYSHLGIKAMCDHFGNFAYAPHLLHHIEGYIQQCVHCQQMQTHHHCPYGSLQPLASPSQPFVTLPCDFLVCLLPVQTTFDIDLLDTILVLTNMSTHFIYHL